MIAHDALSLIFISSFLIGLLFLVLTALLGNIGHGHAVLHHGGHSPLHVTAAHANQAGQHSNTHTHQGARAGSQFSLLSYLNPMSIALFLTGFGFFGYVLHTTSLPLLLTVLLAGGAGIIIAAALLLLVARYFGDSEGATVQDVSDRTGMLGKVSITIQPDNIGEIIYVSPGGMRKSIPARSIDGRRFERDQEVVVVTYQRGIAEVDTWEHYVNQEQSGVIEPLGDDSLDTLRALLDNPMKDDTENFISKEAHKE